MHISICNPKEEEFYVLSYGFNAPLACLASENSSKEPYGI
jgi:hypothetical protein